MQQKFPRKKLESFRFHFLFEIDSFLEKFYKSRKNFIENPLGECLDLLYLKCKFDVLFVVMNLIRYPFIN